MNQESSKLVVARHADGYVVHIVGRGTMHESPSFLRLAQSCLTHERANVFVDISQCDYLDSTFLGCLVSLHKQVAENAPASLVIAGPSARRQQLLGPTHMDKVFQQSDVSPKEIGPSQCIPIGKCDQDAWGRHILDCHRHLSQIEGPQQAAFKAVVDQLEKELANSRPN